MYFMKDIIREGNPILRQHAKEVELPLSNEDYNTLKQLYEYVIVSDNEELVEKYKIRPGVGMAAPQVGVLKRMFAINFVDFLDEKETRYSMAVINPVILRRSDVLTYLPNGEGCLSVDRQTNGVTPRPYRIDCKMTLFDFEKNKAKTVTMTLEGFAAIVFQHEYDHLDGVLFTDKLVNVKEDNDKVFPLYTIQEEKDEIKEEL